MPDVPISAVVTACRRTRRLATTLQALNHCDPPPAEILVHVDGGDPEVIRTLRETCPEAQVLVSTEPLGPGGARHRLINAATQPWVASFDDDARPLTRDFFSQATACLTQFPQAAVLSATATPKDWERPAPRHIGVYTGFACVFNQAWFQRTAGFVPLPFAYCMEEVDLCLQLHALGGQVLECPTLRVEHEADPPVDSVAFHSRALANIALFWFLRCPVSMSGRAVYQILRRCLWLLATCPGAILPGLALVPGHLRHHAHRRAPVSAAALRDWLRLCRHPKPLPPFR